VLAKIDSANYNTQWTTPSAGGGAAVAISDTPPGTPVDGQMWFESDTGALMIRFNDGSSTAWVQVNAAGAVRPPVISTSAPSGGLDGDVWYQVT
jgi:hypothetical protein